METLHHQMTHLHQKQNQHLLQKQHQHLLPKQHQHLLQKQHRLQQHQPFNVQQEPKHCRVLPFDNVLVKPTLTSTWSLGPDLQVESVMQTLMLTLPVEQVAQAVLDQWALQLALNGMEPKKSRSLVCEERLQKAWFHPTQPFLTSLTLKKSMSPLSKICVNISTLLALKVHQN